MNEPRLDADSLYGKLAFDPKGEELGEIEAVYVHPLSGEPEWVAVKTGRTEKSLAPLAGATQAPEGVQLAVEESLVRNAPYGDSEPFSPELSEEQEAELYHYYAIEYTGRGEQPPN
jgi:hypothetical protein